MAVDLRERAAEALHELRVAPSGRRVRGYAGDAVVVDTDDALLVWEPTRVVPVYAVPPGALAGELAADGPPLAEVPAGGPAQRGPQHFEQHTTPGRPLVLTAGGRRVRAFAPDDPALGGRVLLDFAGLDRWLEEEDPVVSHPRDPWHRVDVRHSTRTVQVSVDGVVVAESSRPRLLFETGLPVRTYLPPEDVRTDLLRPSGTTTACAYKGIAAYWSLELPGGRRVPDVVWGYREPLPEAVDVAGLLCFFDEQVDVEVDGVRQGRPRTLWSREDS
jgi:uncharacterized protein (DUF427 family)